MEISFGGLERFTVPISKKYVEFQGRLKNFKTRVYSSRALNATTATNLIRIGKDY